jgi:hypothetical protein
MSPPRYPDKTKAPRSLIAVSIRLVQRYARPGVARELQFKSHFKGEAQLCGWGRGGLVPVIFAL